MCSILNESIIGWRLLLCTCCTTLRKFATHAITEECSNKGHQVLLQTTLSPYLSALVGFLATNSKVSRLGAKSCYPTSLSLAGVNTRS